MGIHINGGTVVASGSMLDRIEDGGQAYVTFRMAEKLSGESLTVKDSTGEAVADIALHNDCSLVLFSSPDLNGDDTYSLYNGDSLIAESGSGFMGGHGGMMPPDGHKPFDDEPPFWG